MHHIPQFITKIAGHGIVEIRDSHPAPLVILNTMAAGHLVMVSSKEEDMDLKWAGYLTLNLIWYTDYIRTAWPLTTDSMGLSLMIRGIIVEQCMYLIIRPIAMAFIRNWTKPTAGFYVYNTEDPNEREYLRVYKNNLGYGNENGDVITGKNAVYTHEHNSWDNPPGINLSGDIFISTDSTGLSGPRQENGSLPDLDFLKLAPNSVVIDAGTKSSGLPFKGSAPDLGAFEYGAK